MMMARKLKPDRTRAKAIDRRVPGSGAFRSRSVRPHLSIGGWQARPSVTRTWLARFAAVRQRSTNTARVARRALRFFSEDVLDHLLIERELGHHLLEFAVFILELLEPRHFAHRQPAALGTPRVDRTSGSRRTCARPPP